MKHENSRGTLLDDRIGSELLAQRATVDAEDAGRLALVTLRVVHDGPEQRAFYLADDEIVEIAGPIAVQRGEILVKCVFGVLAERLLVGRER